MNNNVKNIIIGLSLGCFLTLSGILVSEYLTKEETEIPPPAEVTSTETVPPLQQEEVVELTEIPESTQEEPEEILSKLEPVPEPIKEVKGIDMTGVERRQVSVAEAVASSTFPTWQNITYDANNSMDGNTDTAWVENADGIGVGEWLEHRFASTEVVQEIQFYNGYGSAYEQNGVSSRVIISLSQGETFLYNVNGHWNTLILPYALESEWVRITILEAYSSEDQDTCISEMMVFNKSDEPPTTQVSNWDCGVIGDVSGLTTPQVEAFLEKMTNSEQGFQPKDQWESYIPEEDRLVYGCVINSGNGVPLLIIQGYSVFNFDEEIWWEEHLHLIFTEIWQWNGTEAVEYNWHYTNYYTDEIHGTTSWEGENVLFGGVLEKNDNLFLYHFVPGGGDAPPYSTRTVSSLANGMVSNVVYDVVGYATWEEDRQGQLQRYFDEMSLCPIQSQISTENVISLVDDYFASGYQDTHYVYIENGTTLLPDFDYENDLGYYSLNNVHVGGSMGFATFSGNWATSRTLTAWLKSQIS